MPIKYRYFIASLPLGLIFLLVACASETQSLRGIDVSEEEKLTEEIATTVQTSEKIVEILLDFLLNITSMDLTSAPKPEFNATFLGELTTIFGSRIESIG